LTVLVIGILAGCCIGALATFCIMQSFRKDAERRDIEQNHLLPPHKLLELLERLAEDKPLPIESETRWASEVRFRAFRLGPLFIHLSTRLQKKYLADFDESKFVMVRVESLYVSRRGWAGWSCEFRDDELWYECDFGLGFGFKHEVLTYELPWKDREALEKIYWRVMDTVRELR
jgi:hypothetical protein